MSKSTWGRKAIQRGSGGTVRLVRIRPGRPGRRLARYPVMLLAMLTAVGAELQHRWWMEEPIRWIQTNLRETDAGLDPDRLIERLAGMRANVLHFGMGGITAYYPTQLPFHYPSPYLPPGRDLFGEVTRRAHERGIRIVGRFDLSKTQKPVYDAHPEWFFRQADGEPVVYNGLYSTCINGGYYRDHGMKILAEALDLYPVDGLFFNMFGNQSRDYSGRYVGHCHCDSCARKFRERYGKELPSEPDAEYQDFMAWSSREVAAEIGRLIRARRPNAGYFNYMQEYTDGIMSESNTSVGSRAQLTWPYMSSQQVNRARNSQPEKMSINLCIPFLDYPWRFATVPPPEIVLRLWQNVAHGGAAALTVIGTMDPPDRQAIEAARPVFRFLAEHEAFYVGQESVARVLLLDGVRGSSPDSVRGLFRLLSEEHIPFAVSTNLEWVGNRDYDLVITTGSAPAGLRSYIERGGRVLIVSSSAPEFPVARIVRTWEAVKGYLRIRNHSLFPSIMETDVMMLDGEFTELEGDGLDALTLVPPSMIGPPEKIHVDQVDTTKPGLVRANIGRGRVTWLPWNVGALYYRHSTSAHAGLLRDVIDAMLPNGRQIETDAHPLVEMTLMRQRGRTLLHAVNLSGSSQTAFFNPIPLPDVRVSVAGEFGRARAVRHEAAIPLQTRNGRTDFVIPRITDYELIVLE
jgi:hypothetical protein